MCTGRVRCRCGRRRWLRQSPLRLVVIVVANRCADLIGSPFFPTPAVVTFNRRHLPALGAARRLRPFPEASHEHALYETWLSPNRRVLGLALVPALLLGAIGGLLVTQFAGTAVRLLGGTLVLAGVCLTVGLVSQMRRPRIAYRGGEVYFFLTSGQPAAVPVEIVEAFFIGQGPAHLPGVSDQKTKAVNLVARLSQRAPDWAERDVKPALGHWHEGYVSIRGTWCEPLSGEVVRRLNRRLKEVQTECRETVSENE